MLQRSRNLVAALAPFGLILALAIWSMSPLGMSLEQRLGLDVLFKIRGAEPPPDSVVVVAITRNSARALGLSEKLYQWSRQSHGDLVQHLAQAGARHIVFDVFFETGREPQGDDAFRRSIARAGNVLLFSRSEKEQVAGVTKETFIDPYTPFQQAALDTAPLILPKVPARVSRFFLRHPSFSNVPTLPARVWLLQQSDPAAAEQRLLAMRPDPLLNLFGPPRTITTLEFSDIINQVPAALNQVRGKTVFVGYSAEDQPDQRDGFYTSFTSGEGLDLGGVELAATAYANLVTDTWLREWLPWKNGLLVLLVGAISYVLARFTAPLLAALCVGGVASAMTLMICLAFSRLHLWLPWFHTVVLAVPLCGGLGMWLRSRELFSQKQRLQWAFGKYLPRDELERLVSQQGLPAVRDYHNSVCMVTDAEGYSRLSETLTPVALAELMQSYYQAIIPPIRRSGGIISDVAGDGVIALWLHLERHTAWRTLQPVVEEINRNIEQFNAQHEGKALPTRLGIHCGEIAMGHFGAMDHHEFRAMGDIINTTSRLEGANKQLGTKVLVSESCLDVEDDTLRYLGRFQFVGKQTPLRIFTLKQNPDPVLLKQYQLAVMKLEAGHQAAAEKLFESIVRYYPEDGPTQFVVQNISKVGEQGIIPFSSK
ncbi:CHASE2 domain-containing protein [Ketobacter sp.]|uniref:CHASE2 domain-containing protein n=1 Tax=Ketobacter sp. TaxID=2083498 RepID=UPI000F22BDE6|nr:CHASE2 domain-containing protein [Ketobacter sp.]RLT94472.1 MAG: CHASE2 domain-containing protein [Ketobacter sp.]